MPTSLHAQTLAVDLPPAPLDRTLTRLARQSGVQILFASDIASGKAAPLLQGSFTIRQALDRLLAGQGLEAVERSPGVYLVRPAGARPATTTPQPAAPSERPAAPAAAAQPTELELVVVTGEKVDRSLQQTTTSVAVTTSERIAKENIRDLYDVLGRTANVTLVGDNAGFVIRGMRNTDTGQAPLASIYLDGAALPPNIFGTGPLSSWDLAQVEVLRGPQSTIQGENALAGAVVMRAQDPTMDWDARARLQYAARDDRGLAVAGGGPLIDDELAFRVSVEHRDNDGFVYNPTRATRANPLDATFGRMKLLWMPRALPGLTVKLGFTRNVHKAGVGRVDTSVPDFFAQRRDFSDYPNTDDTRTDVATLAADYAFSPAWTLSSVTNWTRAHSATKYDADSVSLAGNGYMDASGAYGTRSQEFRLHHAGDVVDGLLGLHGSQRTSAFYLYQVLSVATPVNLVRTGLIDAGVPAALATTYARIYAQALPSVYYANFGDQLSERDRNTALFGDATVHLGDHLSLLGGFRYDRQQYDLGAHATHAKFLGTYPDPAAFGAPGSLPYQLISTINRGVDDYLAAGVVSEPANDRDFSAFLPKLGLRYEWRKELSLSFIAQRGYRSGGSSYDQARVQNFAYDPEYTSNYEVSLRSLWLGGTLTFNANAFYTDWKDKQVSVQGPLGVTDTFIVNAARAHLSGLELEASQQVNAYFDWYASLGFERTRYDDFHLPAEVFQGTMLEDYSGREFANVPNWTAALGANWRFGRGWFVNLNGNFRNRVEQTAGSGRDLASLFLLNGRAGYAREAWSAYVFGSNLLDRQYFTNDSRTVAYYSLLGDPRVIGVGVEAHW